MSFKTVSAILRSKWLIDRGWAQDHLPLVASILKGNNALVAELKDGKIETKEETFSSIRMEGGVARRSSTGAFSDAPEGSVAVINITGPIMKYGDVCSYGSMDYAAMIQAADRSQNISSILINIDSPGGEVNGTATLADAIKNTSKPVIAFINDGLCASAAMWVASAADEIYASQPTDMIGSIGVYCTIYDWNGYFEEQGLKVHEIYAPQSKNKNLEYKKAIKGNPRMVEEELSMIAEVFISTIKNNRGEKATANAKKWQAGDIMYASEAIDAGLIDGIKTFDQVIGRATEMKTKKATSNTNHTTMFGNKFSKLSALKGLTAEEITEVVITDVNTELASAGIDHVCIVPVVGLNALNSAITELESNLASEKLLSQKAVDDFAAFKADRGVTNTTVKKEGTDEIPPSSEEEEVAITETDMEARKLFDRNKPKK